MSKTAGIYIKVGDDLVGDYRTMYLGEDGHSIEVAWDGVKVFLQGCVEGLTTYHEERQRENEPGYWDDHEQGDSDKSRAERAMGEEIERVGWENIPESTEGPRLFLYNPKPPK